MRPRRGFTLIELLVVVAIIAILASLLLPALHGAKEQSRISVCAQQLHQLYLGFRMYSDDNGGWMAGGDWFYPQAYAGWSIGAMVAEYVKPGHSAITPWIMKCPSVSQEIADTSPHWGGTYGYNMFWYQDWMGNERRFKFDGVKHPSRKVLIGDAVGFDIFHNGWFWGEWYFSGRRGGQADGDYTHLQGRRANFVFADGHAEFRSYPWDWCEIIQIDYPFGCPPE